MVTMPEDAFSQLLRPIGRMAPRGKGQMYLYLMFFLIFGGYLLTFIREDAWVLVGVGFLMAMGGAIAWLLNWEKSILK